MELPTFFSRVNLELKELLPAESGAPGSSVPSGPCGAGALHHAGSERSTYLLSCPSPSKESPKLTCDSFTSVTEKLWCIFPASFSPVEVLNNWRSHVVFRFSVTLTGRGTPCVVALAPVLGGGGGQGLHS